MHFNAQVNLEKKQIILHRQNHAFCCTALNFLTNLPDKIQDLSRTLVQSLHDIYPSSQWQLSMYDNVPSPQNKMEHKL